MLSSLNRSINLRVGHSRFPVSCWSSVLNIINSELFRHSTRWVAQCRLVERFWLVISVSVLSSDNVSMNVWIGFPGGLVEQLGVCLETTCFSAFSIAFSHGVIKFTVFNWKFEMSVLLCSEVWFQISFSESSAPLFMNCWMVSQFSGGTISSEEIWSCFIESLLIGFKAKQ